MPTFKNFDDLEKYINYKIQKAMELTRDMLFEIVSEKVVDYYNEPVFNNEDKTEPRIYERTGNLMESLTASRINRNKNGFYFTVGWDKNYLEFRYYNQLDPQRPGATGLNVLQSFNKKRHGWTVEGAHNYWDEALEEIDNKYGGVQNLFKTNCKKVGIPIS